MKLQHYTLFVLSLVLFAACQRDDPFSNEEMGDQRYTSFVFDEVQSTRNVTYGSNSTQAGTPTNLAMDIYEPEGDTETARPLLIYAHGGGFVGGDRDQGMEMCNYFARSGYVAASISYRLVEQERNTERTLRAIIDAGQDMRAAIRFFMVDAQSSNLYRIDTSRIFVAGYSAGAFVALHTAYINQMSEVERMGGATLVEYVNQNGGIRGNSGNPGPKARVRGVINISGAMVDAQAVDAGEAALYSLHGVDDAIVPFESGDADESGLITQGSGLLHREADAQGVANLLNAKTGVGHSPLADCTECDSEMRSFLFQQF